MLLSSDHAHHHVTWQQGMVICLGSSLILPLFQPFEVTLGYNSLVNGLGQ